MNVLQQKNVKIIMWILHIFIVTVVIGIFNYFPLLKGVSYEGDVDLYR